MSKQATASFKIENWDEQPYQELDGGGKLTRASVVKEFSGQIEGKGNIEYLMAYRADGAAEFVGLERFVGRIAGRSGTLVFRHTGMFEGGVARDKWMIIPGTGTGELEGIEGEIDFEAGHEQTYEVTLRYSLGTL